MTTCDCGDEMEFGMTENLKSIQAHQKWLKGEEGGKRANLQGANLQRADLRGANLQRADLQRANLQRADLQRANLQGADLRGANLQGADLQGADLQGANLQGANLDFSCLPLWCGSFGMKVDLKIAAQIALHLVKLNCEDPVVKEMQEKIRPLAEKSHQFNECG